MNIIAIFNSFQTQEQAMEYLEKARWHGKPVCPYCGGEKICRHVSGDRANQRWQCQECLNAFSATVGTIFHGTHVPLKKWFLVLALMLNAKKSASACQIARDIGLRRPTVWSMMHRIRAAMTKDMNQSKLLHGIVEADETYVGGKPRKNNKRDDDMEGGNKSKRGRGTDKLPVIGVVERHGRVVARPAEKSELTSKGLSEFITDNVDVAGTLLITDEFPAYRAVGRKMLHTTINHAIEYANGLIHTNTMEGFWALVKRAWYGQHHHYSKKYAALYISEASYKYNTRKVADNFDHMLRLMVVA